MTPKFRAWDTKRKKMWSAEEMGRDQLTLMPDGSGFINVHGASRKLSQLLPHLVPLQFTGRCDKNGKEIYKGDIAKWTHLTDKNKHFTKSVDSSVKRAGWILSGHPMNRLDYFCPETHLEVIGNIYEHPDLLEEQNNG